MFEFFQDALFGQEIEAHGEKWQSVYRLPNGYHLAVKLGDKLPCHVHIVRVDVKANEDGE
jgi:hypothetical protein